LRENCNGNSGEIPFWKKKGYAKVAQRLHEPIPSKADQLKFRGDLRETFSSKIATTTAKQVNPMLRADLLILNGGR
jgi:hypothetical protein